MIGEKELEKYVNRDDFYCLSHLPVNFGATGDRYCQCGKKRSPCELANFLYTNVSCVGRRVTSSDDILKIERNTVFLTKKNLMMNQFLEYTNSAPPPSSCLQNVSSEGPAAPSWLHPPLTRSRLAIRSLSAANSSRQSVESDRRTSSASAVCTTHSPLLDKRIVSLLRGITLYWFICLNTVLAKSDLLRKRSPISFVGDVNCDSTSGPPFCHALAELQVSLSLLENVCDLESDILWNLFRDSFVERSHRLQNHAVIVLPFDQRTKNNLFDLFVRRLFSTLLTMSDNNQMPGCSSWSDPNSTLNNPKNPNLVFDHSNHQNPMSSFFQPWLVTPQLDTHQYACRQSWVSYNYEWPVLKLEASPPSTPRVRSPAWPYSQPLRRRRAVSAASSIDDVQAVRSNRPYDVGGTGTPIAPGAPITGAAPAEHRRRYDRVPSVSGPIAAVISPLPYVDAAMGLANAFYHHRTPWLTPQILPFNTPDALYWNAIAQTFGDEETNAAFANDLANANAENRLNGELIAADRIKVEPAEAYEDDGSDDAEAVPAVEDEYVDVVGIDGADNVGPAEDEGDVRLQQRQLLVAENGDVVRPNELDGGRNEVGSQWPTPSDAFEPVPPTHGLAYAYYLGDAANDVSQEHPEPMDHGGYAANEPHLAEWVNVNDVMRAGGGLSTVASHSSAGRSSPYAPVAASPVSSPEIDPSTIDDDESSAPDLGGDWRSRSSTSAEAHPDVKCDTCDHSVNVICDTHNSRVTSADATVPDDHEPPSFDHVPSPYQPSEPDLAAQFQLHPTNSLSTHIAILNSLVDPHADSSISGSRRKSAKRLNFQSPVLAFTFGIDQEGTWPKASESADTGEQCGLLAASPPTSNNTSAANAGNAINGESDDSELIALTHPQDANQLPAAENRCFWPPDNSGTGQQECAEFNMWGWPWVNSLQVLRQEPHQPQFTSERNVEFPQYHMWQGPLVNMINSQHPAFMPSPQQPTAATASLALPAPPLRSDAILNASSHYNMWSSPQLVNMQNLSSLERHSPETNNATNPMPSHNSDRASGVQFPPFVPVIRGRVTFGDHGAFQPYRREPPSFARSITENLEACIRPSVVQFHRTHPEPVPDRADDEFEADKAVGNPTDENAQLDRHFFLPIVPAFSVPTDAKPAMRPSESGLQYELDGRQWFVFQHELDSNSSTRDLFQPKYAVSLNDKGCQTEPELFYASCSPFQMRGEPPAASRVPRTRFSPSLNMSQGWSPPHHHQLASQAAPQHLWPPYQAVSSHPAPVAPASQPGPMGPLSPSAPLAEVQRLQTYSLNDVLSQLGQPGFANVGELALSLAMTSSST